MKKVSNEFINLSKKIKTQDLKLTINDGELTVQEVHFMPVNIFNSIPISRLRARKEVIAKELKYSFEGQLFKTIMQQIEITVKNASEIKGKKVDFKYGILVKNEFEYLDIGEYYIKDVEDDKNKEELVVTGYDKMLNFMTPFKQSDLKLTYPCKMGQLVSRMGEVCGVEVYSTDFYNSNLIVDEDFFTIQELTYRDVLEKIAQTTLTTIFIKENKLYLCKIGESVQTLDTSFLSNLVIGEKFGPVNALVLGRGSVEDNIESVDQQSINANGRCEIRFDENEFIDSKREEVIDGMLQQINGMEYYAIEASNLGILWLDPCDVIIAKDREESEYKTIYLKASVTINTGIEGEMEADIPEETTTEYKVTTKEEKKTLKVERLAKKNKGIIEDVVKQVGDRTEKETSVTQDIDSIVQVVATKDEVTKKMNELKQTVDSTINKLTNSGGNNIFYYSKEYWSTLNKDEQLSIEEYSDTNVKQNSVGGLGYILNNGNAIQNQVIKNGKYTISFLYYKLIDLAEGYVLINGNRYDLDTEEIEKWKEKIVTIDIDTNTIDFEIISDTDNSFIIADLMCSKGNEKTIWSQNANETITDTVSIGKGIQVNSSTTNTYTRIDADGNRTYNASTGEVVAEQTDKGTKTKQLEVKEEAKINSLLIQEIDGQAWITGIGG